MSMLPDGASGAGLLDGMTNGELEALALKHSAQVGDNGEETKLTGKQADKLIALASGATLWHSPDGTAYADISHDGHRETWPLRSRGFERWLARRYYNATQGAFGAQAIQDALRVLEARARYDGPPRTVHVRVADHDGRIYIDMADEQWRAIEIGPAGWRVVNDPPVRFRRPAGMLPLSEPVRGGLLSDLRKLLNVRSDADFVLVVSWLLAALRPSGPYPLLGLAGEAGTAKTTCAELLRGLVDPSATPTRSPPREDRDLMIAANNGHVVAIDNLSHIPSWLSDGLCRIATGGGFAARQLYTDSDEVLLTVQKPIITTAISDVITRGDLADRSITVTLNPIAEAERKTDAELRQAYEAARPRVLGILLDAMVHGLQKFPHVRLDRLPRMADFAKWASACETAFWPAGTFAAAYGDNRAAAGETVLEADPVATAVRTLMADNENWAGTATALLAALAGIVGESVARWQDWPRTARSLAARLRQAAPLMRQAGIDVKFQRQGRGSHRIIHLERAGNPPSPPSPPSAPLDDQTLAGDGPAAVEAVGCDGGSATVSPIPLNPHGGDDGDGGDAILPPCSSRCVQCGAEDNQTATHWIGGQRVWLHRER